MARSEFIQSQQLLEMPFADLREWDPYRPLIQVIIVLLVTFLWVMRGMFSWWPFHPIGYVFAVQSMSAMYWSSLFLAWLVKVIFVRYRGADGLRNARPFFLGLIIGSVIWSVIIIIISSIGLVN